jgi:hypothetical protein
MNDEDTENTVMLVMFVLTLAFVVAGLVYFVALGLLHR